MGVATMTPNQFEVATRTGGGRFTCLHPGAANHQVTQRNIGNTICNRRWSTRLIRPPAQYTSKLKRKQFREYGNTVRQTRAQIINPNTGKVDTTRALLNSAFLKC
jgi:hypothetical protein